MIETTAACRPIRRRARPGALPAILAAGAALSCAPQPSRFTTFDDLIAARELHSPAGRVEPADVFCPDVTRLGVVLEPAVEVKATVSVDAGTRLHVAICGEAGDADADGELAIEITSATSPAAARTASLAVAGAGTAEALFDLSELGETSAEIRLRATPGGRKVLLHDLYLTREVTAPPPAEARQILLISVDTLREDAIAALGGSYPTPHLDRFVAESEVWSPHYASGTWTMPSHAGLLTGQNARVHNVFSGDTAIRSSVPTLAERFRAAGYSTAALVFDCVNLEPRFGFGRGFDRYEVVGTRLAKAARELSNWLVDRRDDSFFFFFHTYDPHSDFRQIPYEAPGVTTQTIAERFSVPDYGCRQGACASLLLTGVKEGEIPAVDGETEILEYLYSRSMAEVDEHLGALFDNLRAAGIWDRMTVILTSDHGEAFQGPGRILHGSHWEEILRIPLVIKWPGGERGGERRTLPTSALDLAPTLAEAYGLDPRHLPGTSLLQKRRPTPVFAGTYESIVIEGRYKAVFENGRALHLFDLEADPGETRDLRAERPDAVARLKALLDERQRLDDEIVAAIDTGQADEPIRALSPEEIERLQALGYLGQ